MEPRNIMKESEKILERKLAKKVKQAGGWCLKLPAIHHVGIPDRLCLFDGGEAIFVEVKTTGEKPRKIQLAIHRKLRNLGFTVLVIDKTEEIEAFINER